MKRIIRRSRNPFSACRYEELESRQLLAGLFQGTPGADIVKIDYVDGNTINITINDTVHDNVDATDLVRINLGAGNDHVTLDDRVDVPLSIALAEVIEVVGTRDNDIKIGFKPTNNGVDGPQLLTLASPSLPPPGMIAGRINNHVTFIGHLTEIRTDAGNDVFTVRTDFPFDIDLHGEEGDDVFRFSENYDGNGFFVSHPKAFGDAGNDRMVFRNETRATGIGGLGYDTLDYSQLDGAVLASIDTNERIIGAKGQNNSISQSSANEYRRSDWFVKGAYAQVDNLTDGTSVELYHFNRFNASNGLHSHDRVWVMETASDLLLGNFDWAQVSSEMDTMKGSLETIQHDVRFAGGSYVNYQLPNGGFYDYGEDSSLGFIIPINEMTLVVSNAAGEATTATLDGDSIVGMNGSGAIYLGGASQHEVTIHGSTTGDDIFVIEANLADLSIYTHGGDDLVMVGGTVKDGGNLGAIRNDVFIGTGLGLDRVIINDQLKLSFEENFRGYQLAEGILQERTDDLVDSQDREPRFANIRFSGSTEIVRINGSDETVNRFEVTPSRMNRFVLDSPDKDGFSKFDQLTMNGVDVDLGVIDNIFGSGSWRFPGLQGVFFDGIEVLGELIASGDV